VTRWAWKGRIESRDSQSENKFGFNTGVYGETTKGLGVAGIMQVFKTDSASSTKNKTGNIGFSLAYRPEETKWILLDRLDFIYETQSNSDTNYNNSSIVNNMNVNYMPNRRQQVSVQYASKYGKDTIDSNNYSGYTDLMGLEVRDFLTGKWDVGITGNILHTWNTNQYKYSNGFSIGRSFIKNVWMSLGYNFNGFKDGDFPMADVTAEGFYVKFRMRFDQVTAKDAVKWVSGL